MSVDTTQLAIKIAEVLAEEGVPPSYEAIAVMGRITTVIADMLATAIEPSSPDVQAVLRAIHDVARNYHVQSIRENLWN